MDHDAILATGLVMAFLGVPLVVAAWADRAPIRARLVFLGLGICLALWGGLGGGHPLSALPGVLLGITARVLDALPF